MKKSIITAAILAATAGFASSASAVSLSYSQDSGFIFEQTYSGTATPQAQYIGVETNVGNVDGAVRYQSLWWGNDSPSRGQVGPSTPIVTSLNGDGTVASATAAPWTTSSGGNGNPDSALKVIGLSGTVTSGAGWVPISQTFHSNQVISVENNGLLSSGVIRSVLSLDGSPTPKNDIAFNFFETPNGNSIYNCPDGSGVSCDIFQFSVAGFHPSYLTIGDKLYELSFGLIFTSPNAFIINPGNTWGNSACEAGNFCVLTKENNVNWLTVGMRLDEVPEPGSLALISLGLLGLGASLRRRKNNA